MSPAACTTPPNRCRTHRTALLAYALLLLLAPATLPAAPPGGSAASGVPAPPLPATYADHEVLQVSVLLRAPDGSLVRITRGAGPTAGGLAAPAPGQTMHPVYWGEEWLEERWLGTRRFFTGIVNWVRGTWDALVRILSFVGVAVLLLGASVVARLLRPALLGVSEQGAFLLALAVICTLWVWLTALYTTVVYTAAVLAVPWALMAALGLGWRWLRRRLQPAEAGE